MGKDKRKNRKRKIGKLTDDDILYMINHNIITVDTATAKVYNGGGREIRPTISLGRDNPRYAITLHMGERRKKILRNRLVWMAATRQIIPKDFEVHHGERGRFDDGFDNLLAVHRLDHPKLHRGPGECEIPE